MIAAFALTAAMFLGQIAPLAIIGTVVVTQSSCDKPTVVENSKTVLEIVGEALPIFEANGLNVALIREGKDIAQQVLDALEANQNETAFRLVAELIKVF